MELIKSYGLGKTYRGFRALSDVSVTINKGDIYGLVGKNGAGKTTLMRILCGLTVPDSGSFTMYGTGNPAEIVKMHSKIGAIIEAPALYLNLNARQNLTALALLRGIPDLEPRVNQLLDFAGLAKVGNKKVRNFSLGMKQRLAIAIALLNDPELLILDEPVNGLDPLGIVEMREVLKKLNQEKGITIIISSHLLSELSQLATRYGFLDKGRLIEEIEGSELDEKMSKALNISLTMTDDMQKATELLKKEFNCNDYKVEGDTIVITDRQLVERASEINKVFALNDILVRGITVRTIDLETYFVGLTREAR